MPVDGTLVVGHVDAIAFVRLQCRAVARKPQEPEDRHGAEQDREERDQVSPGTVAAACAAVCCFSHEISRTAGSKGAERHRAARTKHGRKLQNRHEAAVGRPPSTPAWPSSSCRSSLRWTPTTT